MLLEYNGKLFKPYDDHYFVSEDGEIYSAYKKGLLKHYIDHDGYHRVDIHSKHIKVHKLVYTVWCGTIPGGYQVNHLDDNKDNNSVWNLYLGTQQENISDCRANQHRVGHITYLIVHDKLLNQELIFPSVKDFLAYTGHSISNGSISHCKNKQWFKNRYDIIEQQGVTTIESYKSIRAVYDSGVENKAETHEASRVGRSLSPSEAQGAGAFSG